MLEPREHYPQIIALLDKPSATSGRGIISFRCPSHPDSDPSAICWVDGKDHKLNLKCYAGCTFRQIRDALGIKEADRNPGGNKEEIEIKWVRDCVYDYREADGTFVARKVRLHGMSNGVRIKKRFFWQTYTDGKWVDVGLESLKLPIFNLKQVIQRKMNEKVYLVEGEACSEAANGIGLLGTNLAHTGKKRLSDRNIEELSDCDMVIIPDSGTSGENYLEGIVSSLLFSRRSPKSISVLELGEPKTMDLRNWVDQRIKLEGRSVEEVRKELELIPNVRKWQRV